MSTYVILLSCASAFVFFGVWAKRLTASINTVFDMLSYENRMLLCDKEKLLVELRECKKRLSAVTKRPQRPKKNKKTHPGVV